MSKPADSSKPAVRLAPDVHRVLRVKSALEDVQMKEEVDRLLRAALKDFAEAQGLTLEAEEAAATA